MVILGNPNIQQLGFTRTFDPSRGYITETIFEGTQEAIRAAEIQLEGYGVYRSADYTNPPLARLTVRTPDQGDGAKPVNGILATNYDLDGNATGKHIFEHWKSKALGLDVLNAIKTAIDNRSDPEISLSGNSATLYDMLARREDAFVIGQFVFKVTYLISNDSQVEVAFNNTSCIYSRAKLLAEAKPPSFYETGIIAAEDTVLNDYYAGSVPTGHTLGWLKNPPSITNVAGNRSAVVIEYLLEAWRDFLYPSFA